MNSNKHRKNFKIVRFVIITVAIIFIVFGGVVVSSNALAASSGARTKVYTSVKIEEGDSLWSIAGNYCDSDTDIDEYISELKTMNNIVNDRGLKPGNYLMIYYLK